MFDKEKVARRVRRDDAGRNGPGADSVRATGAGERATARLAENQASGRGFYIIPRPL